MLSTLSFHGALLTLWTDVLVGTLIIFLPIFLKAHLLFEYPGIWLLSLFLELCLRVKQAVGLTCEAVRGEDWSWPQTDLSVDRVLSLWAAEMHCGHRGPSRGNRTAGRLSLWQTEWRKKTDRQSEGWEVRREQYSGREDVWRGRRKKEVFTERAKVESQTSSQSEPAFYLVAVECKATDILTSPLETAVFPFFKDIFSLFIGSLRRDPSLGSDTGFLL